MGKNIYFFDSKSFYTYSTHSLSTSIEPFLGHRVHLTCSFSTSSTLIVLLPSSDILGPEHEIHSTFRRLIKTRLIILDDLVRRTRLTFIYLLVPPVFVLLFNLLKTFIRLFSTTETLIPRSPPQLLIKAIQVFHLGDPKRLLFYMSNSFRQFVDPPTFRIVYSTFYGTFLLSDPPSYPIHRKGEPCTCSFSSKPSIDRIDSLTHFNGFLIRTFFFSRFRFQTPGYCHS